MCEGWELGGGGGIWGDAKIEGGISPGFGSWKSWKLRGREEANVGSQFRLIGADERW